METVAQEPSHASSPSKPADGVASEAKRQEAITWLKRASDTECSTEQRVAMVREAWALLEDALAIDPRNLQARFLMVSCAMNTEDFTRAKVEGLKIYNSLRPRQRQRMGDAVLHISLAHASKMLGENADAVRFASEASELFPDDPHPHMTLGEVYEANNQNQLAEQSCRQALLLQDRPSCKHPLNIRSVYHTHCCLAAALIKQGLYTDAEQWLHSAAAMVETPTLALRHLVDVYHFGGWEEEALQVAQRLALLDPRDEELQEKIELLTHIVLNTDTEVTEVEADAELLVASTACGVNWQIRGCATPNKLCSTPNKLCRAGGQFAKRSSFQELLCCGATMLHTAIKGTSRSDPPSVITCDTRS